MDYYALLNVATELGYRLALAGAETFRIEESIVRILRTYNIKAEVFAITNCLIVGIETPEGKPMTRQRRIENHGNDLDAVERYNNLSRKICQYAPEPSEALQWLQETECSREHYSMPSCLLGYFLVACGFSIFFGGCFLDSLCAGCCGIAVGLVNHTLTRLKVNSFFTTISASFIMALTAYALSIFHIASNADAVIIGTLMLLVPGLLFTNAMRDIIFGDTNSGINRIVQVLLIAAAIALGTGSARTLAQYIWGPIPLMQITPHSYWIQLLSSFVSGIGFAIIFNIHGKGMPLCALGSVLSWGAYCICISLGQTIILGNFAAAIVAASYAEIMARVRKYPAISYLVISLLPMIPGAGIYYTTNHLVQSNMQAFSETGLTTIAIAGILAVGILLVSTTVRLWSILQQKHAVKN